MESMREGLCHLVTVGTTPPGAGGDVVDALLEDLRPAKPARVIVFATEDSVQNAERLLQGLGIRKPNGLIRIIASAQSLDEAYHATEVEISALRAAGIPASDIILHYTAGTKVMSAGAVLAALNHEVQALRYLYSPGRNQSSVPVTTVPEAILVANKMRLASTLMRELRFRAARDLLLSLRDAAVSEEQRRQIIAGADLAAAYAEWDSFRAREVLNYYRKAEAELDSLPLFSRFRLTPQHLAGLEQISHAEHSECSYPMELLIDLVNNAIRRLAERRPDDALIRLHRAAELFAQGILMTEFGIRTDDVDIRKVPPRHRTSFEAERRLDDATIKLGLRKSFELLEILGHPVGAAFTENERVRTVLQERRNLVLAHGTKPASMQLAMDFFMALQDLVLLRNKQFRQQADALQFPWIKNEEVLRRLSRRPAPQESVIDAEKDGGAKGNKPRPRRETNVTRPRSRK